MKQKASAAMRLPYYCFYNSSSSKPQPHDIYKEFYNSSSSYNDLLIVIIRLHSSNCRIMKLLAQAVVLALFIMCLPLLGGSSRPAVPDMINSHTSYERVSDKTAADNIMINFESVSMLFHDLANEGLYKHDGKTAFILSNAEQVEILNTTSSILIDRNVDHVDFIAYTSQMLHNGDTKTYDFIFTDSAVHATEFVGKKLNVGGIVALQLGSDATYLVENKSLLNQYKIVYFRRLSGITYVAMKKIHSDDDDQSPMQIRRRLQSIFNFPSHQSKTTYSQKKAAALKKLEDVQLEEPRTTSKKSRAIYMKKTRYLPDLLNDSLESYPRRVFIDVGTPQDEDETTGTEWFKKNYPTRNKEFQLYHIEAIAIDDDNDLIYETTKGNDYDEDDVSEMGMCDWLKKNVKEEEYVVMKAEAEVVEELVKSKAIELVDELFMECKTKRTKKGGGRKYGPNYNKRAYWECLALYGRLRDLGVAVHQWWG